MSDGPWCLVLSRQAGQQKTLREYSGKHIVAFSSCCQFPKDKDLYCILLSLRLYTKAGFSQYCFGILCSKSWDFIQIFYVLNFVADCILYLFFEAPAYTCFIPPPLVFLFLASETCNDFHPMFFTHDRSFEEFFCICIQLLNKTWKEMRATSEDFNKARKRAGWG